jgi:O-antigen ligase
MMSTVTPAQQAHSAPAPAAAIPAEGHTVVRVLLCALVAAMMFSTALTNLLAAGVCAAAAVYWYRYRPWALLRMPLALLCLAFIGWLIVRDLAAGSSLRDTFREVNDFRPLLFLVFWAPLFAPPGHRRAVALTFFSCMTLFCVAALGSALFLHKHITEAGFHTGHDLSGPMMAFAIVAALQMALASTGRRRIAWSAFAVLAIATLAFATERRTGYVGFATGVAALVAFNLPRRNLRAVAIGAGLVALSAALILASPAARDRMNKVVEEVTQFTQTDPMKQGRVYTSSGLRLRFWTVTLAVIKDSPVVGGGVAQFAHRYNHFDNLMGGSIEATGNPHNEYLYVTAGLGVVGLALYLALYGRLVLDAARRPDPTQRRLVWLAVVTFMVSILFNSLLIDMVPGHLFALLMLCLAWYPWPLTPVSEPSSPALQEGRA